MHFPYISLHMEQNLGLWNDILEHIETKLFSSNRFLYPMQTNMLPA